MKNEKIKNITLSAVFVAVISAFSQISLPLATGVALTGQVFAIALCGFCLPCFYATFSVIAYIILGFFGVPVFANFGAGSVLFGFSGGFIFGFLPFVLLCSFAKRFDKKAIRLLFGFLGLAVCHICGVLWFSAVSGRSIFESFSAVSLPFIVKDIICVITAFFVSKKILNRVIK